MFAESSHPSRVASPTSTRPLRGAHPALRPRSRARPSIPPSCHLPSRAPTLLRQRQRSRPPLLPPTSPLLHLRPPPQQHLPSPRLPRMLLLPKPRRSLPLPPPPPPPPLRPPHSRRKSQALQPSLRLQPFPHARLQSHMTPLPTSSTISLIASRRFLPLRSCACRRGRGTLRAKTRR